VIEAGTAVEKAEPLFPRMELPSSDEAVK